MSVEFEFEVKSFRDKLVKVYPKASELGLTVGSILCTLVLKDNEGDFVANRMLNKIVTTEGKIKEAQVVFKHDFKCKFSTPEDLIQFINEVNSKATL